MSKRPEPGWSLWCDWPGCDYQFEYGEYTIFGDGWEVDDIVTGADGWESPHGLLHYCGQHPAIWASDIQAGHEPPERPYLLIHDGDTDSPLDHDGKVTLIEEATR